jgi:hypothetical protein
MGSDTFSRNVLARKTHCHIFAKKRAKGNPPESVPEAIT